MNISDLILKLQAIKEEHGDLSVVTLLYACPGTLSEMTFTPECAKLVPCTCSGFPSQYAAPFPWPPATH
jgi:hypothetical protein